VLVKDGVNAGVVVVEAVAAPFAACAYEKVGAGMVIGRELEGIDSTKVMTGGGMVRQRHHATCHLERW
jgi:hypothetical protein